MGHDAADDSDDEDEECTVAFRYKGIATAPSGKNVTAVNGGKNGAKPAATPAPSNRTKGLFGSAMRAMRVMTGMKAVLPETKCAGMSQVWGVEGQGAERGTQLKPLHRLCAQVRGEHARCGQ